MRGACPSCGAATLVAPVFSGLTWYGKPVGLKSREYCPACRWYDEQWRELAPGDVVSVAEPRSDAERELSSSGRALVIVRITAAGWAVVSLPERGSADPEASPAEWHVHPESLARVARAGGES